MFTCSKCSRKFARADNLRRHAYESCYTLDEGEPINKKLRGENRAGNF